MKRLLLGLMLLGSLSSLAKNNKTSISDVHIESIKFHYNIELSGKYGEEVVIQSGTVLKNGFDLNNGYNIDEKFCKVKLTKGIQRTTDLNEKNNIRNESYSYGEGFFNILEFKTNIDNIRIKFLCGQTLSNGVISGTITVEELVETLGNVADLRYSERVSSTKLQKL